MVKRGPSTEEKVARITTSGTIIVSVISAVAGIGGTLIATHKPLESDYQPVGTRAKVLDATWSGTFVQPIGADGNVTTGSVVFVFEPKRTLVQGRWDIEGVLKDGTHLRASYKLSGGFLDNRFLRLQYETADGAVLQFGSVLAELMPDGQTIRGSFLGYGAYSRRIVTGELTLKRRTQ